MRRHAHRTPAHTQGAFSCRTSLHGQRDSARWLLVVEADDLAPVTAQQGLHLIHGQSISHEAHRAVAETDVAPTRVEGKDLAVVGAAAGARPRGCGDSHEVTPSRDAGPARRAAVGGVVIHWLGPGAPACARRTP